MGSIYRTGVVLKTKTNILKVRDRMISPSTEGDIILPKLPFHTIKHMTVYSSQTLLHRPHVILT
jgi:hypothetical protein